MTNKEYLQKQVEKYMITQEGDCHVQLWPVAVAAVKAGYDTEESLESYITTLFEQKWPDEQPDESEIRSTVKHAIEEYTNGKCSTDYTSKKTYKKIDEDKIRDNIKTWRKQLTNSPVTWINKITASDTSDKRITTKTALQAIFKNAKGKVCQCEEINKISWMHTDDHFAGYKTKNKFFGIQIYGDENKRTDNNVLSIVAMLIEVDEPLDKEEHKEDLKQQNFIDTCHLLEQLELNPTTVTFSGHKSFHCLFRLTKPITPEKFKKHLDKLKIAYKKIGVDEKVLTVSRCTRMPLGCTKSEAEAGNLQHVMYLDENAEISFEDYVDKIYKLADKIDKEGKKDEITDALLDPETNKIDEVSMLEYIENNGYRTIFEHNLDTGLNTKLVHFEGKFVEKVKISYINNQISNLARETKDRNVARKVISFIKTSGSERFYDQLNHIEIKENKDEKDKAYFYFKNGVLEVNKSGTNFISYDNIDGFIWKDRYESMTRNYNVSDGQKSMFEKFIDKITQKKNDKGNYEHCEENFVFAKTVIGYLLHQWKDEANAKAVLLTEDAAGNVGNSLSTGGTGKGLFFKAIQKFRFCGFNDAKQNFEDDKYCYSSYIDGQSVYLINDIKQGFSFQSLYNIITEDFILKKKYENDRKITFQDSPKIMITSNHFPDDLTEQSTDRRHVMLVLANYYTVKFTPDKDFKCRFFTDWNEDEWSRFDAFMIDCIKFYFNNGLKPYLNNEATINKILSGVKISERNWLDKWIQTNLHRLDGMTEIDPQSMWEDYQNSDEAKKFSVGSKSFFTGISNYFTGGFEKVRSSFDKKKYAYKIDWNKCIVNRGIENSKEDKFVDEYNDPDDPFLGANAIKTINEDKGFIDEAPDYKSNEKRVLTPTTEFKKNEQGEIIGAKEGGNYGIAIMTNGEEVPVKYTGSINANWYYEPIDENIIFTKPDSSKRKSVI